MLRKYSLLGGGSNLFSLHTTKYLHFPSLSVFLGKTDKVLIYFVVFLKNKLLISFLKPMIFLLSNAGIIFFLSLVIPFQVS